MSVGAELLLAARVLDREGLVDAFGHVSARSGDDALISPAVPLGSLRDERALVPLPLRAGGDLPDEAPREAWLHRSIYQRRTDVGAVCRAQPPSVQAVGVLTAELPALSGQAALVGARVPVLDDARLIRDDSRAATLAERLADDHALILRGNGAVTTGADPGEAVVRMWLLERSARTWLRASAVGQPRGLDDQEAAAWTATSRELLGRLWSYLRPAH